MSHRTLELPTVVVVTGALHLALLSTSGAAEPDCADIESYATLLKKNSGEGSPPQAPPKEERTPEYKSCLELAYRYRLEPMTSHYDPVRLEQCYKLQCSFKDNMSLVIFDACKDQSGELCEKWKRLMLRGDVALSKGKRAVGGILIGLGLASVVLGAVNIGYPLFQQPIESGVGVCVNSGLRSRCEPNPYGLGISLIGVGTIAIGFGGAILARRFEDL